MADENIEHQLKAIPALAEVSASFPFMPDWLQLWPQEVISGTVEIRARSSAPFPLTGFAPMLIYKPGRTVQLRNTTGEAQLIHIVAGLGIDPPQFVLPTTIAKLKSIVPTSIAFGKAFGIGSGTQWTIPITQVGTVAYVIAMGSAGQNNFGITTAVSIGGKTGVKVVEARQDSGASQMSRAVSFWRVTNLSDGNLVATLTAGSTASAADHAAWVLSFRDGVIGGLFAENHGAGAGAHSISIDAQDSASRTWCARPDTYLETGGADLYDAQTVAMGNFGACRLYKRDGADLQQFSFSDPATPWAFAGVETFPY